MAVNGYYQITASFTDPVLGTTQQATYTIPIVGGTNEILPFVLQSGFNQFTIPVNATTIVFNPPNNSTNTYTLKGVTGDTGLPLSALFPTGPQSIPTASGSGTFGITAASTDSAPCTLIFR